MRKLSRRDFLKNIGLGTAGLGLLASPAFASESDSKITGDRLPSKIRKVKETFTVCAYCGCGCGIIIYSDNNKIVFCEGDPDHPINEGSLCSKGNGIIDVYNTVGKKGNRDVNKRRILKPLYRAPGSTQWEEKSWDWALTEIAKRVKATRDASFEEKDEKGNTVNRTKAIATFGSASLDNEENYLLHKMFRAWGLLNIEHHARL